MPRDTLEEAAASSQGHAKLDKQNIEHLVPIPTSTTEVAHACWISH
jgi:hypothetical protein